MQTEPADSPRRIGILGTGLIGGSLLLALRRELPEAELVAGAPSSKTRDAVLASGAANEVFNPLETPPAQALSGCDIAFLAAPPESVCRDLPGLAGAKIGLVVDVASVKGSVMKAATGLGNFVGGHPMAGTEGVGFAAADPDLFRGAAFVYCVPDNYSAGPGRLASLLALIGALGMRCIPMSADEHDARLAVVSHLPHVAAFGLSLLAARRRDPQLARLVGGGFRDTTRIAASSPGLWTDILRSSPALKSAIDEYIDVLRAMRDSLDASLPPETLRSILAESEHYRREIPEGLHHVPHA